MAIGLPLAGLFTLRKAGECSPGGGCCVGREGDAIAIVEFELTLSRQVSRAPLVSCWAARRHGVLPENGA
jgi:hypothetical protein